MNEKKRPPRQSAPRSRTQGSGQRRPATGKPQPRPAAPRQGQGQKRPSASAAGARPKQAAGRRPSGGQPAGTRPKRPPSANNAPKRLPAARKRPPKRRLRWGRIIAVMAVLVLCAGLGIFAKNTFFKPTAPEATVAQSVSEPLISDSDKAGFDATINSDSAILISADNGDVLYEKEADTQRAPASLVKMMTVYVALRNNDDIDRELQMPEAAYEGLEKEKASQSGLKKGETVTIRDLCYAAILASGGDAANALALATSGNIESFVELMNEEAKHLGLDSTTFTNPTGLDDEKQVSTCRDMARLLKGALGNTLFQEIFTAREYTTTANDTHPEGLALTHTMEEDLTNFQRYFDTSGYEIVGGKTGYTQAAGNCLATLAQKEKAPDYIVVTMHATGDGDQYYQAVHDAVTLYGEAYNRDNT